MVPAAVQAADPVESIREARALLETIPGSAMPRVLTCVRIIRCVNLVVGEIIATDRPLHGAGLIDAEQWDKCRSASPALAVHSLMR
jgi:hypothetical protein